MSKTTTPNEKDDLPATKKKTPEKKPTAMKKAGNKALSERKIATEAERIEQDYALELDGVVKYLDGKEVLR